jgi:hypothetical protein
MEWTEVIVLVISFVILLLAGVPISFSIGIATLTTMFLSINTLPALTTVAQRMATGIDSFALLAIRSLFYQPVNEPGRDRAPTDRLRQSLSRQTAGRTGFRQYSGRDVFRGNFRLGRRGRGRNRRIYDAADEEGRL